MSKRPAKAAIFKIFLSSRPVNKDPAKNKLNTRLEKLRFAFSMYDLDGDDKISKVSRVGVLIMLDYKIQFSRSLFYILFT